MINRKKLLFRIPSARLRKELMCSKELCKKCPDLSSIPLCNVKEGCQLKRATECESKCCDFGL